MTAILPSLLMCIIVVVAAEHANHMQMRFMPSKKYATAEPEDYLPLIREDYTNDGLALATEHDSKIQYTALTLMHDQSSYIEDLRRFQPAVWFRTLLRAGFV